MGTTTDKLNHLIATKEAIREAIISKGVSVADTDTFCSYAAKIAEIQSGGGEGDTITYWDITDHLETLAELVLYAYLVKAESTSRGIFIVPIGIYYVEGGDTDQVSPKAIALDINRVVVVENNTPQSVYDILGTDDLTQFGARRLSKEDFYNTNI